jgi:hypothetical protein
VFEELDGALVFLGGAAGLERAQVTPAAALRVNLPRVKPEPAGLQLADHGILISCSRALHITLLYPLHITYRRNLDMQVNSSARIPN